MEKKIRKDGNEIHEFEESILFVRKINNAIFKNLCYIEIDFVQDFFLILWVKSFFDFKLNYALLHSRT